MLPKNRDTRLVTAVFFALLLNGCGAVRSQNRSEGGSDASTAEQGIPGYVHALSRSRFNVGTTTKVVTESGMTKIVGDRGVFATELASQATTAIPNQLVPSPDPVMAFQGNTIAQNAEVEAYFLGAGLPPDQLLSVTADSTVIRMMRDGLNPLVSAEFSILNREFAGVPIPDSTAWAILGADGSSLEESVFWPALDRSVVDQLHRFQALLMDPVLASAFYESLPAEYRNGELIIHHTGPFWRGTLVAVPCFRASSAGTNVCFDESGHLVELPDTATSG